MLHTICLRVMKPKAPKTYAQLKKQITYSLSKLYRSASPQDVEDCIQYCMLGFLTNPRQTVDQAVIDFLRRSFGESRRGLEKPKHYQLCNHMEKRFFSCDKSPLNRLMASSEASRVLRGLPLMDRVILILYFSWGLTLKEIGWVIGRTECLCSHRLSLVLRELSSGFRAAK